MNILVINAGSSSLKYQLLNMDDESMVAKGNCERIGLEDGIFSYKTADGFESKRTEQMPTHKDAFQLVTAALTHPENGVVNSLDEVAAIGHRVAQGGSLFAESVLVDDTVIAGIEELIPLAPLHNKPELDGILACIEVFGKDKPQCAVFDTSFHSTMPAKAYMYGIPYEYYEKYQIRRYGFHGTSHRYVANLYAKQLGKPVEELKIITCHIGNGSSLAAIKHGKVVDTSMGLTPLDGFMMGTRSGSLDPSIVTFLMDKEGLNTKEMDDLLNKKSGLLGISGISSDDRDITDAEEAGNPRAILAHEMLSYQIAKTIGAYVVAMDGLDCIIFTAGLGENQSGLRSKICQQLKYFGIEMDEELNEKTRLGAEGTISAKNSAIPVVVIPTNEELVIAQDTLASCLN